MSANRLRGESVVSPDEKEPWAFHEPVLVEEVVDLLLRGGEGLFLDGTVGGGGHARALLERCPACRLVGVDRDADAVARAESVLAAYGDRIRLLRCRFDEAPERAGIGEGELAGALLDLGVSSHQIDRERRGFTFAPDAPLDMRMGGGEEDRPSAADLLNEADEDRLVRI